MSLRKTLAIAAVTSTLSVSTAFAENVFKVGIVTLLSGAAAGSPEIFNTNLGSQFTSEKFTAVLKDNDIKISMDGKGR